MGFKKDVFGKGGMLHRAFGDGYEVREQQVNMSVDCAKAIQNRDILLAEGATGVGKSFAYLIASVSPSIRQALVEKGFDAPIVISTSTKVLQDQVCEKDVPEILKATGQDLRVVLAKGRNNYISARRLHEFAKDVENLTIQFSTAEDAAIANRIAPVLDEWIETADGEFASFDESVPREIRLEIESTERDCHGEACDFYAKCPYHRAKSKRKSADILIVNHALLAVHIAYRNVLPRECNTFIIDEAHKFFDAVSGVFQAEITLKQVEWFLKTFRTGLRKLRDLVMEDAEKFRVVLNVLNDMEKRKRKDADIASTFFQDVHAAVQAEAENQSGTEVSSRFGYTVLTPDLDDTTLSTMLSEYVKTCEDISDDFDISLDDIDDEEIDSKVRLNLVNLYQSAIEIRSRLKSIVSREDTERWCYWSEVTMAADNDKESPYRLSLKQTPIDITEQITPLFEEDNAVIFTSATLQVSDSFSRIRQQLGLRGDQIDKRIIERVYPSPFPYRQNVEIHLFGNVILDRPSPYATPDEKEQYWQQQARLVEYYLRLRDGRALVLCSSQQLLHELYERLEPVFYDIGVTSLRQIGTDKLRQTFNVFKEDEQSVLFGVASCWEGIDAPGSTLETVIIPQLPLRATAPIVRCSPPVIAEP